MLLELLWSGVLVDAAHEDVLVDDPLRVGAEKIVVEGESTGSLTIHHLKVPHLFTCLGELVVLWNCHDSRVEGSIEVSANLGMAGKYDTCLLLEDVSESGACRGLRQVVQVEVVLVLTSLHRERVDHQNLVLLNASFFRFVVLI